MKGRYRNNTVLVFVIPLILVSCDLIDTSKQIENSIEKLDSGVLHIDIDSIKRLNEGNSNLEAIEKAWSNNDNPSFNDIE